MIIEEETQDELVPSFVLQVFEAAQQGFPRATGIEINRVLVYYARLKALSSGLSNICRFKRENLWKVKRCDLLPINFRAI